MRQDFEKLGAFYLGKRYDPRARARLDDVVLYDSRDLVTHAVCVGMTGSGKTGLCVGLLEEAAIDGVPAIVIDPKGDLSNLLLTFPDLRPGDFRPWINEQDAARKGLSPDEFAAAQAALWTKGLAEWGQDGARIARLRDAAEFEVYTPGSSAGTPVSILKSFACPPEAVLDDAELLKERIATTATSLLGLLGIEADPIKSREHILISTILHRAWSGGENLDLGELIRRIQNPGVQRVGVLELEGFFPARERFELAMGLNNLLAAPGFAQWMEGVDLDIEALLHARGGRPRVAIFSIAHLSDAERMFFVALLLNQVLGWVRQQSGTTSLRAIVYMDEIAGYFPPSRNPASKGPLLTLMKQARAFGVGVVLATQNPVDLDYKGLSNAGTWFIGRLQTERDKARVLDGLEGAAAGGGGAAGAFDRAEMDRLISGLDTRVFLMNNVHEDAPVVFETRWCMSYLRGPLTRGQLRMLKASGAGAAAVPAAGSGASEAAAAGSESDGPEPSEPAPPRSGPARPAKFASPARSTKVASPPVGSGGQRPVLGPDVPQFFVPVRGVRPPEASLEYRPRLLGTAKLYFDDKKLGVSHTTTLAHLAEVTDGAAPVDWDHADEVALGPGDLAREPDGGDRAGSAAFAPLPAEAGKPRSYEAWKKAYADMLFRTGTLELLHEPESDETSRPGEDERAFRARLAQTARERRDEAIAKARVKYAPKLAALQERLRKAEQAVETQKAQARDAGVSTAVSFGSAILGALLGRKTLSTGNVSRAASAARGVSRTTREAGDIERARENVDTVRAQIEALDEQFKREVLDSTGGADPGAAELERTGVRVKKTNVSVTAVVLAWVPVWVSPGGEERAAW
jgi:hypothetical protein